MAAGTYSCVMRNEEGTDTLWPRFFHWARTHKQHFHSTRHDWLWCHL